MKKKTIGRGVMRKGCVCSILHAWLGTRVFTRQEPPPSCCPWGVISPHLAVPRSRYLTSRQPGRLVRCRLKPTRAEQEVEANENSSN